MIYLFIYDIYDLFIYFNNIYYFLNYYIILNIYYLYYIYERYIFISNLDHLDDSCIFLLYKSSLLGLFVGNTTNSG